MYRTSASHARLIAAVTALLMLTGIAAWAQIGETRVLFDCDSLDGVSVVGGGEWPETELSLSADEQFVSEGDASIHLSGVAPEDATGNSYLSMAIDIDLIDLTGQALQLDAWTDLPETTRALYVRAYNDAGECVLSFYNWGGPIGPERTEITLVKGFGDVLG
ncbi:MAG: hypothetical protein GF393_02700, partial [Armatimonadia bacterium]|nr:hypothetical protein [Armatimonadia bacterium]